MKKILLFLILATSFSISVDAQEAKLTIKEERAFDLLKATLFTRNKFGPEYLDHHEYNFQRDENGDLLLTSVSKTTDQLIGDKYDNYKISNRDGIPYLIEMNNECERDGFIRIDNWEGDKIPRSASRSLNDGKIIYDSNNRIVAFDTGKSYKGKGKKKVYTIKMFSFKYNENGQLSELSKEFIVHKKSSSDKELKKDYSYKEFNVKIIYGDKEVTLVKDVFSIIKGESQKSSHVEYTLSRKDNQTKEIKKSTSFNKNGDKETIVETIQDYDQKLRLMKSESKDNNRTVIIEYSYDNLDNILTKNTHITNKDKTTKEEQISNTYNKIGLLETFTMKNLKNNQMDRKIVTEYSYHSKKENQDITKCLHEKDYITKVYNATNELFQESKPSKIREKENGVWGNWKPYRM